MESTTCLALTKKGKQCHNKAKFGNYCGHPAHKKLNTAKDDNTEHMGDIRSEAVFPLQDYDDKMSKMIVDILSRPVKEKTVKYGMFTFTEKAKRRKDDSLKEKHREMKEGEICQNLIGNWYLFTNLGNGDPTSLDVRSDQRKIIMEVKNSYNTENDSSKKTNQSKLAKFKKEHPDWMCMYGIINSGKKQNCGDIWHTFTDGVKIDYYSGECLFDFIFGQDKKHILNHVMSVFAKYDSDTDDSCEYCI